MENQNVCNHKTYIWYIATTLNWTVVSVYKTNNTRVTYLTVTMHKKPDSKKNTTTFGAKCNFGNEAQLMLKIFEPKC